VLRHGFWKALYCLVTSLVTTSRASAALSTTTTAATGGAPAVSAPVAIDIVIVRYVV